MTWAGSKLKKCFTIVSEFFTFSYSDASPMIRSTFRHEMTKKMRTNHFFPRTGNSKVICRLVAFARRRSWANGETTSESRFKAKQPRAFRFAKKRLYPTNKTIFSEKKDVIQRNTCPDFAKKTFFSRKRIKMMIQVIYRLHFLQEIYHS